MNKPIHISDTEFENRVLNSEIPVVVDFWAPWCGPCKMIAPVLEKIAEENADKLIVAKVNTDDRTAKTTRPNWSSIYPPQKRGFLI